MTHFSSKPNDVRVECFTKNMKWKYTISVTFRDSDFYGKNALIHEAFRNALKDYFVDTNSKEITGFKGWFICLNPYHEFEHPVALEGSF